MSKKLLTGADLNNQRLINLADGTSATDAVTLQQLQSAIRGLDWKQSVRAATTTNVTLSGTQTIDGVALAAGDRVLVKDQTTATGNGIYVVAAGAWARSVDADDNTELTSGLAVTVESGTVNADRVYILVTDGTITIGTSNLTFTQLGGGGASYTAGNGISISGSVIAAVVKSGGGLVVDSTGLSIDTAVVARRYSAAIGDGSATAVTVTHNLNTRDLAASLVGAATPWEVVEADVTYPTVNTATVTFATAPASGAYRLTLVG